MKRRVSNRVHVGRVAVGGGAPISIQSMTNTPTRDAAATLAQIRAALPGTTEEIFPVVDKEGRFAGVIDVHALRKAIFDDSLADWVIAQDMLRPSAGLSPDMDLHIALQKFLAENCAQMAVLEDGKVVGTLHQRDLIAVYEEKSRVRS